MPAEREMPWVVVAVLHHQPGRPTTVAPTEPGVYINTEAWSRSEGWCEHCRIRRPRRTTYLIKSSEGRLAQVGSSCLSELVGLAPPLTGLTTGLRVRSPHRTHREATVRTSVEYIDTVRYLSHVAQSSLDSGFVPSASATRTRPATWASALASHDRGRAPSMRARRRAQETLDWARHELNPADDFQRRLVEVLGQGRLTLRELPTAAAGIYAYHQHLRRAIARQKAREQASAHGPAGR